MADDVKNKIAELEKELYAKDFKTHTIEDIVPRKEAAPAPAWGEAEDTTSFLDKGFSVEEKHRIMKKFVQISIGFFVIAAIVAGFIWWRGSNIISGENIAIDIAAPLTVSGGEPFETKFTITNDNKVSVEMATLFVEYPTGFYSVGDSAELPRTSKNLGAITPGQSLTSSVSALLYGENNTNKEVSVTLEYRMSGSNAILKKSKTYLIKIASSPVNVKLKMLKEVSSGQEVNLAIEVASNSKDPISTLVISAAYPSGFSFLSADPAPSYSENTWSISGLSPQEKRTIKIRGIIEGQENEEKVTKISLGTPSAKDERLIGVVYNATTELSVITKSVLGIDLVVNNNRAQNNVASLGKGVKVEVLWQNNNPTRVSDAVIEVRLKGGILDRYSIYASGGGFYRSVDNTIVWDKTGARELASLDPGARGIVSFSFSPIALGVEAARLIKNPQMIFEVRATARRISEASASEDITTFATRSVKFETDLRITARGLYFSGPFENTGPIPPQADKETMYTISLSARNSSNSVSNVLAKTSLPIYVKWLGKVYPDGEDVAYNESTREITWNVGRIPSGGTRDTSFQISLLPSVSQINSAPFLIGDTSLAGTDDFTKTEINDKKPALTTNISSDPQFSPNDANVVN
ncbi:MAG: hypothetical protein HZB11_00175 [Candidatus Yonathbacteria bacterium]|nr:hypothetical protein [Candidatus Yonathbacteria bacterium]